MARAAHFTDPAVCAGCGCSFYTFTNGALCSNCRRPRL